MAVNPDVKKVLVIGGKTAARCGTDPVSGIEEIHMAESTSGWRLCQQAPACHRRQIGRPRVRLFFEDGVQFVKQRTDYYDLIIIDSTDPISLARPVYRGFLPDATALNSKGILITSTKAPSTKSMPQMVKAHAKLKEVFEICMVYQFHMPTYARATGSVFPASTSTPSHHEEWERLGSRPDIIRHPRGLLRPAHHVREMLEQAAIEPEWK